MHRANNLLINIIIITTGAFAGCTADTKPLRPGGSGVAASNSTATPRPSAVDVFEVQPPVAASELSELLIPAAISVEGIAVVLAQREGTITQLRGQEGARVVKGETIALLGGDSDLRAQLRQAELEVNRLKVEEQQYESRIKINRSELERETALSKDGLSSKSDLEHAQHRFDAATYEYEKTRLATQIAQARVEAVKIELEKTIVRAPITGIVTRQYVNLGTSVVKNDKLFEVSQLAPLQVRFQLPQTERRPLGPGSLVNLSPVSSDRIIAQARIRRTNPVADAASNTLGYLADVVRGADLIPGLAVNVRVPRATVGHTLWVPRAAFLVGADLRGGATGALLVVEGDKCADRIVGVSRIEGDQVEVTSGLNAGDYVILAPPTELKAGDVVEVKGS